MMRFELSRIAEIVDGDLRGGNALIQGMSHDTRRVRPGNLFCALPGEQVHGHEFVGQAGQAGAAAALVSEFQDCELAQVRTDDVRQAMAAVAGEWRTGLDVRVAAVTGSNGKTTVKEMLAAILRREGPTLATEGNYNNEIGVPLTLARLGPDHAFAVLELGASHPGDIEYLAAIAAPEVGIVTNAAPAHLEGFGSIEGVARTKGELFAAVAAASGTAVINRDDPHYPLWQEMAGGARVITFGAHAEADVRLDDDNGEFAILTPDGRLTPTLRLPGRHNRLNALAATAAALGLGVSAARIVEGLESVESLPGRLEFHSMPGGGSLIDDTYNANPASLYAALGVLRGLEGERWLVLGDMAELGPDAVKLHGEMGQAARDFGISRLFALGPVAAAAVGAFGAGGSHFDDHDSLVRALREARHEGRAESVHCLVKGSRSMTMERVVQGLLREAAPC